MKTAISPDGTIWNSGDVQPEGLLFLDFASFAPAIVPAHGDKGISPASDATAAVTFAVQSAAGTASGSANLVGTMTSSALISTGTVVMDSNGYAPLVITPEFGPSITNQVSSVADPTTAAEIEGAIDEAINYYESNFTSDVVAGSVINSTTVNTVTATIKFGYGTLGATPMTPLSGASDSSYFFTPIGNF